MIVQIEKAAASASVSLDYNEKKVAAGDAEIIGTANLDSTDKDAIYDAMERLERGALRCENCGFHMSVNPSETDSCSEEEVMQLINGIMQELGYENQPYVVYRHHDIDRQHYHVVSTRVGEDHYKINNSFEKRRADKIIKEMAEALHFSVPAKGESSKVVESLEDVEPKNRFTKARKVINGPRPSFDRSKPLFGQLKHIFEYSLQYRFSSEAQFDCLMEDMGVKVSRNLTSSGMSIYLQGLDADGEAASELYSDDQIGIPQAQADYESALRYGQMRKVELWESERVSNLAVACFEYSKSLQHLKNMLRKQEITMHVAYTETGQPFGVTFIDHKNKMVLKNSELRQGVSPKMIMKAIESGKWREMDRGESKKEMALHARRIVTQVRSQQVMYFLGKTLLSLARDAAYILPSSQERGIVDPKRMGENPSENIRELFKEDFSKEDNDIKGDRFFEGIRNIL